MAIFTNITLAFQVFQIMRYGTLLSVSVLLSWILTDLNIIDSYERLLLLGSSLTFFWVPALFDSYLLLARKGNPTERAGWRALTLRISGASSVLTFAIGLVTGLFFLISGEYSQALWGYLLYISLESFSTLLIYHFIIEEKGPAIWGFGVISQLAYLVAIILPQLLDKGQDPVAAFQFSMVLLGGIGVLKTIVSLILLKAAWKSRIIPPGSLKKLSKIAFPIGISILLSRSAEYVDSYLVLHYFSDQFALFRYGAKELPFVLILANALSLVKSGDLARTQTHEEWARQVQALKTSALRLIGWMFPLSILLLIISKPLFAVVFDGKFTDAFIVFDVYLLLVVPRLVFPQTLFRGKMNTKALAWSAGAELVLNVCLSLIFMQFWGLAGIALATLVSFFGEKTILAVWVWRKYRISFLRYTPLWAWLIGSVAIIALACAKYAQPSWFPSEEFLQFF